MIRRHTVLAPLVALSLVLFACSGDDGGGSGGATTVDSNLSPQEQLADEFIGRIDDEDAMELLDTQCMRDLFALLEDDDAEMLLEQVRANAEELPDDLDPELQELLETISFRLFDCVIFDEGDGEFEIDPDVDGEIEIIELDPDGEGALEG